MDRLFTVAEANATLPFVQRVVRDIVVEGRELRRLFPRRRVAGMTERIEEQQARVRALIEELEQLGCLYKDFEFERGLVDFPAEVDGREVYLCWREGEESVTHFHAREATYADREPLPGALVSASTSP